MTTIIPNSISELELFVQAAYTEGLRQLFAADELPFSIYHDEFENLELKAYELDDPILKLLITKKTKQIKILELSLSDKNRSIKNAALQNSSIINEWSDSLLVPETLANQGILRFIESLNVEERRTFLFENTALGSTQALKTLHEIYLSADTDLEMKGWLAATLSTRLPDYAFEDPFSGSYEPPLEDWKREQMMAEVLASILTAPKDLLIDLIAPHTDTPYPKFHLTNTSEKLDDFLSTQELKILPTSNLTKSVEALLTTLNAEPMLSREIEFVGKIGQHLDREILGLDSQREPEKSSSFDEIYVAKTIRSAAACLMTRNERFDDLKLMRLLLCDSKSIRRFALEHIDFSRMSSPAQLDIIKKLWKAALKLDGNDAMEALAENEFALGLTKFIYSDAWYDQHDEMETQFGEDGLKKLEKFFSDFFSHKNLNKYESGWSSSTLSYSKDASLRRWQARTQEKNPTATDWDSRPLEQLKISELIDRLKVLAREDEFSLKEFALIQAELSKRTMVDEKSTDVPPVKLPLDVLVVLDQLKNASRWHTWLLCGLVGFWIYILLR